MLLVRLFCPNPSSATQLNDILTGVLGIPLCPHLPTPNARKTCALAIWLIQSQRLPADTLAKAAPRIAFALKRGLDGELGKEGKKGSANDGLKVCGTDLQSGLYLTISVRQSTSYPCINLRYSFLHLPISCPPFWSTLRRLVSRCVFKHATRWEA